MVNKYALWFLIIFVVVFLLYWFTKPWYVQSQVPGTTQIKQNPLYVMTASIITTLLIIYLIKIFYNFGRQY